MNYFKRIEFEIENIKELCETLNIDKYTYTYVEKIYQELDSKSTDTESYVFCLQKIYAWIEENHFSVSSTTKEYSTLKGIIVSLIQESENTSAERITIEKKQSEERFLSVLHDRVSTDNVVFLSHSSNDKKYADAIRNYLSGLGLKDECLIYTSHPCHKIPLDNNIFDYLRSNINQNVYMIILWSNSYLDSPACMNELGALWVVRGNYTNVFVPGFDFSNPKFKQCSVDTNKMGIELCNNPVCKTRLIELKNNIVNLFNLDVKEEITTYLIDKFMKEIEG